MNSDKKIPLHIDWQQIDTVLLDMDGTLLDRHFDDYFWHCYVPENYALLHDLEIEEARRRLRSAYDNQEGTLAWTNLDYWSEQLGLDIPELKRRVDALVDVHTHVVDFLEFCRKNEKMIYLVTNAHHKTLAIKMAKAALNGYWDQAVCSEQIGLAKEEAAFWPRLERHLGYDKHRTLLVDDTEQVLDQAKAYGLKYLVHVARASSRAPHRFSAKYPSIVFFNELISGSSQQLSP